MSYMKFSTELTKYNVNVATRTLRLDFKHVHAEDHVGRNALQHQTNFQATHCRCLHDIPRNARSQTWYPAMDAKDPTKRESTRRFLTASRTMKYFMQASSNINGRTNGENIWITSEQLIFRTEPLQNNWNDFRYDPKQMERGPIKSRPDYHQTTRAIVSMNKEAGQIEESKRRHNYREDLDPEKLDWLTWLSHNWKWYFAGSRISGFNSTQWHHQKSARSIHQ